MNPVEIEDNIRNLDLMLGGASCHRPPIMHGGACAKDLEAPHSITSRYPIRRVVIGTIRINRMTGEIVDDKPDRPTILDLGYEKYVTGVDNEMLVLGGKQPVPLSCYVKRGYDFQI